MADRHDTTEIRQLENILHTLGTVGIALSTSETLLKRAQKQLREIRRSTPKRKPVSRELAVVTPMPQKDAGAL